MSEQKLIFGEVTGFPGLVVVVHHPTDSISDEENTQLIELLVAVDRRGQKVSELVFTDGPALTAKQRKDSAVRAKDARAKPTVAVVSSSAIVRGAVTALSWLGIDIKAFNPTQVGAALQFLKQPSEALDAVKSFAAKAPWPVKSVAFM